MGNFQKKIPPPPPPLYTIKFTFICIIFFICFVACFMYIVEQDVYVTLFELLWFS